jgi:hypothetical protein
MPNTKYDKVCFHSANFYVEICESIKVIMRQLKFQKRLQNLLFRE